MFKRGWIKESALVNCPQSVMGEQTMDLAGPSGKDEIKAVCVSEVVATAGRHRVTVTLLFCHTPLSHFMSTSQCLTS